MMHRYLIVLCLLLTGVQQGAAQWWTDGTPEDVWLLQIGFSGYGAATLHTGDFTLPEAPTCCSSYSTALGIGPSLSAFLRQEITKTFRLHARVSYAMYNATFTATEDLLVSGNVNGRSLHTLETRAGWLGGELLGDLRVGGSLRLMAGMSFGVLTQATFSQNEELEIPATGTFENGSRVRGVTTNIARTSAPSNILGIVAGAGYDIPLTENHSVVLTPEALVTLGLTDLVVGQSWKATMVRVGASLAFSLNAPPAPLPVERRKEMFIDSVIVDVLPDAQERRTEGPERVVADTTVTTEAVVITERAYRTDTVFAPQRPDIVARLKTFAVGTDGKTNDVFTINVSTQFITEALPLLPVVFFESQSISLSFRYNQLKSSSEFIEGAIPPRTTDVHHEVLNIIGRRLTDNQSSTIRLRGTADPTTENGDCDLARKRAQAVKDYLVRIWNIDGARIAIASGSGSCAPERTTRQPSEEGYSENRRVEIETDDLTLLMPVARRRFNEARTVDPPRILFDPAGTSTRYITDWKLVATSGETIVFSQEGKGTPSSILQDLSMNQADMMRDNQPVVAKLTVNGLRGVTANTTAQLIVKKDTVRQEIERLTLTLFDVASDKVSPIAEQQIRKFVEAVPVNSIVLVRGFADMLGNAEFNRTLSQKRATAVCDEIRKNLRKTVDLQCDEIRTDRYPPGVESYKTPEERFLSRTVQIEVKKSR
ncbi:MAG: hypothetical protein SGJ05_06275 [bacterium]|nr:hypothetical protein [bacterium]